MPTKLVLITGGVISGLGKGVISASVGKLLQSMGLSVSMIKIDPYLNPDPGTLNPVEHGEVFITEEVWDFNAGPVSFKIAEIDEDFGHYERFLDINMHPSNNITSGQVMLSVILGERKGEYLGKTIRLIPHVTDKIKERIRAVIEREKPDAVIVELGGTVGDYEAMPFVEALRQLRLEFGNGNSVHIHVTYVPYVRTVGEYKTKPAQLFFREVLAAGLPPDVVVARVENGLPQNVREKLALYASVPPDAVFEDPDMDTVYELPLYLEEKGFSKILKKKLKIDGRVDLTDWESIVEKFKRPSYKVKIAMVGKYWRMSDVYISIVEALKHAGAYRDVGVEILPVDSEGLERGQGWDTLEASDGVLLTPGFGSRGTEGMIRAAGWSLESEKPTLGICFGAQLSTVAFARKVMGWSGANSTEIDPETPYPVIDMLPEQKSIELIGGTMRLGGHLVKLLGGRLREAYGKEVVVERFRHRYHIMNSYVEKMVERGYRVVATDMSGEIINAFEIEWHPFFLGVQFHPEFKSRPGKPSPTYLVFIDAILSRVNNG